MAERNDNIAPFERRELRRWTRVADYWPEGEQRRAFAFSDFPIAPRPERPKRGSLWGFLIPIAAVAITVTLSIWGSGALDRPAATRTAAAATISRGLVFGLCSDGGLTNCVASGDSFYLGGKNVRIAGIEAPQLYGAACPKEAALARDSAARLEALLNSGELEMSKIDRDLDRYGLLLRNVSVDGKDVGRTMAASGLARQIGDMTRSWC